MKTKINSLNDNRILFTIIAMAITAGIAFGQGLVGSGDYNYRKDTGPYDIRTSPPVGLTEAYAMATKHMGSATNRYYCVSASCLNKGLSGSAGWTFWFSNTNGQRCSLEVTFDKEVYTNSRELEGK